MILSAGWALSLRRPGWRGQFTLVLLHFNQSIFLLDVVGSAPTLGAIPFFGFPVPSKVCVFHRWVGAEIGFIS
jgi:hypothetical protein